tara:strand:- start:144 stop:362 length:219 start_codon:yes stop_codon:yes gene_type:complete
MAFLSIEHPKIANQGLLLDIQKNKNIMNLTVQTIVGDIKGNITMGYDGHKLVICVKQGEGMEVVHIPITQEE